MIKSASMLRGIVFGVVLLLAAAGVPLARKFLYGYFHGANIFVFVEVEGRTLVYKNPEEIIGLDDEIIEKLPAELSDPNRYETYYNICWFDSGTLVRCKHSFHHTPQNALYCDAIRVDGSFIAKVLEER